MNKYQVGYLLCAGMLLWLFACKNQSTPPSGFKVETMSFNRRYCVNDNQCVDMIVMYPSITGGDSASMAKFKGVLDNYMTNLVGGPSNVPFEPSISSAADMFVEGFISYKRHHLDYMGNWIEQLVTDIPLINTRIATAEMSVTMNAIPGSEYSLRHLKTYDFQLGRFITVSDIMSDTAAFRPLLEKHLCQTLGLNAISELKTKMHSNFDAPPMPFHVSILPEGLHIAYNWFEISTDKIPITDFRLTWEQLGPLADKKRWIP